MAAHAADIVVRFETFLIDNEPLVRGVSFVLVLAALLAFEAAWPRRARVQTRLSRWTTNGVLIVSGAALTRAGAALAPALAATGAAAWAGAHGIGLFNGVAAPLSAFVASVLLLDLAVWAQHVVFHRVGFLWRLHRVHHADRDFDATTALRFHPLEIAVSMGWKAAVVVALGAPVAAVVVFEVLLNACAMFNHANLKLPLWFDRIVRLVFVTPDMHRVHHSVHGDEFNTNFGFCLSLWDRLFRVYRAQPRDGHEAMTIGLAAWQDGKPARIGWALLSPFRR